MSAVLFALSCLSAAAAPPAPANTDRLGDPLPDGAAARLGTVRFRSAAPLAAAAFTPDGKTLISAGDDGVVFWDVATGRPRRSVPLPRSAQDLALSKDGQILAVAVAGTEGGVYLLDGRTGERRKVLREGEGVHAVRLSPDGKTAVGNDLATSRVIAWDCASGEVLHRTRHPYAGRHHVPMAFLPDGEHLVAEVPAGKLHVVRARDSRSVRDLEPDAKLAGRPGAPRFRWLAVTPDGKQALASPADSPREMHFIEVATGKRLRTWKEESLGHSLRAAVTPDGRHLVQSAGGREVTVWELATGKRVRSWGLGEGTTVNHLALSRDGKAVAVTSSAGIALFEVATGKPLHPVAGHREAVVQLAFSPDGGRLVTLGKTARVWDARSGEELHRLDAPQLASPCHLTFDGEEANWIGGDGAAYRWRCAGRAGAEKRTTPRRAPPFADQAVSPDGRLLAGVGRLDRRLRLVHLTQDRPDRVLLYLPNGYGNRVYFSPDGRLVAVSGSTDKVVSLFDANSGELLRRLMPIPSETSHYGTATLAFSPDGRALLKHDSLTRLIETASGGQRLLLPQGRPSAPALTVWSPDGRLVARGYPDGVVTVFDTFSGEEILNRQTGQGRLTAAAFSRDGRRRATAGADTTVLVWLVPAPPKPATGLREAEAWQELENTDAAQSFRAVVYFSTDPAAAVKLFGERLRPRAAADPERIAQWIKDLDADEYAVREKASESLAQAGPAAKAAVEAALKDPPSLEVRRRCEALLRKMQVARATPDRLRPLRAVEVLERIGTPAAREVLRKLLAAKPPAELEASVRAALQRTETAAPREGRE